jgi:hypothetical protein
MARPCKLTSLNGATVNIDYDDLSSMGPHIQGGSFIIVKDITVRVLETPDEIMKIAKVIT